MVGIGNAAFQSNLALLNELRQAGIPCDMDTTGKSAKAQFKLAYREGAALCVVIGDDEIARHVVKLKNIRTSEESMVERAQLIKTLQVHA